jgi:hypothetical protein
LKDPTGVLAALAITMDGVLMEVSSGFVIEEKLTKTAAGVKQDKPGILVLWLRFPVFRQMPILHRTKRLSPD